MRLGLTMRRMPNLFAYIFACVLTLGVVAFLDHLQPGLFVAYAGPLPALPAAFVVCIAGGLTLGVLVKRFGYHFLAPAVPRRARALAMLWTLPFMVAATLADMTLGFPRDINVAPPAALLFYPVMGLLAQFALHVVPFALLLLLLQRVWRGGDPRHRTLVAIVLASAMECVLQTSGGKASGLGLTVFVVVHLLAFGIVELTLFRRFDYLTAYAFRLTYYAWWHLAWGMLRTAV